MKQESPKITVLMPVRNGEPYLREAINSIIHQTFSDFELLIIDNASTDHSVEIVRSYQDSRIKLVCNSENLGLIASLNNGLDLANGQYIARMDADDISYPDRLEKQVRYMDEHQDIGVCGTWFRSFNPSGITDCQHPADPSTIKAKLFFHCYLGHPTVMIRNALLKRYGLQYDPNDFQAEDYGLWVRCSFLFPLANIPQVLLDRRVTTSNISIMYQDQQMQTVAKINKANIERLGKTNIAEDLWNFHQTINFYPHEFRTVIELKRAEAWLVELGELNQDRKCYPEPHFTHALAEKWHDICQWAIHSEEWGQMLYELSPLNLDRMD